MSDLRNDKKRASGKSGKEGSVGAVLWNMTAACGGLHQCPLKLKGKALVSSTRQSSGAFKRGNLVRGGEVSVGDLKGTVGLRPLLFLSC